MAQKSENKAWVNGVAGGVSSCLAKSIMTPFQRVITLRQTGHDGSVSVLLKKILKEERKGLAEEAPLALKHLKGFWRGNLVSIVHRLPYSSVQLAFYERARNTLTVVFCVKKGDMKGELATKAVASGAAAGVSATVAYPLDVMKMRLQSGDSECRTFLDAGKKTFREKGFLGFYAGLMTNLVKTVPEIAINLTTYETVKFSLIDRGVSDSIAVSAGGIMAALAAIAMCYPLETVKKCVAMGSSGAISYEGPADCVSKIMKSEGVKGFYRGAGLEAMRAVPQVLMMWHLVEFVRTVLGADPKK